MLRAVVMIGLLLHRVPSTDALEADRSLTRVSTEMGADDSIPIVDWATGSESSPMLPQDDDPQALADPVASSSGESSGSETSESPASAQSSVSRSMEYSQSSGQSSSEGSDRSFAPRPSRTPARTPAPTHTPAPTRTRAPTPSPFRQNTAEPAPTSSSSSSSSSESHSPSAASDSSPALTPAPTPVRAPASAPTSPPAPTTNEPDNTSTTSASASSTPAPITTIRNACLASVSVEGMQSNFCVYSVGEICSSTIKNGLCPGPQPGLERGSYCDMIRSDDLASSSNNAEATVYGCKLVPTRTVSADTTAAEGNHGRGHGRGRWVRRHN